MDQGGLTDSDALVASMNMDIMQYIYAKNRCIYVQQVCIVCNIYLI